MATQPTSLTLVSGADHRFYRSLRQFVRSAIRHDLHRRYAVVLYDLGLNIEQQAKLLSDLSGYPAMTIRQFPFKRHPPHVRMEARTYAWKPLLIHNILEETRGKVLWLDSATLLLGPLDAIERELDRSGVYTPISGAGAVREWVHPATLSLLGADARMLTERNRAGGVCGFDYRSGAARALVADWARYALQPECIAPEGASTRNHRYDQAILTILLYQYRMRYDLMLTTDEVDISSTHPVPFLSVRNIAPNWIPVALDSPVRHYFLLRRLMDVWMLRAKCALHRLMRDHRSKGDFSG